MSPSSIVTFIICSLCRHRSAHQITVVSRRKVEEHWDPKTEDLAPLKVVRELPQIFILLSKEHVGEEQEQKPLQDFLNLPSREKRRRNNHRESNKHAAAASDLNLTSKKNSRKSHPNTANKKEVRPAGRKSPENEKRKNNVAEENVEAKT